VRPHVRAALATRLAHKPRLDVGKPLTSSGHPSAGIKLDPQALAIVDKAVRALLPK
jgi:hypothetical protein